MNLATARRGVMQQVRILMHAHPKAIRAEATLNPLGFFAELAVGYTLFNNIGSISRR